MSKRTFAPPKRVTPTSQQQKPPPSNSASRSTPNQRPVANIVQPKLSVATEKNSCADNSTTLHKNDEDNNKNVNCNNKSNNNNSGSQNEPNLGLNNDENINNLINAESELKNNFCCYHDVDTHSHYPPVQYGQAFETKFLNAKSVAAKDLKFKIPCLGRRFITMPVLLIFSAVKKNTKIVGSLNYRAILEIDIEKDEYEYEKTEIKHCLGSGCKNYSCQSCSDGLRCFTDTYVKTCACMRCKEKAHFLYRKNCHQVFGNRVFIRKRRVFCVKFTTVELFYENSSAPHCVISTKPHCSSTYMLNREDQHISTAILKQANVLLKFHPTTACEKMFTPWTEWTEFANVKEIQQDKSCAPNNKGIVAVNSNSTLPLLSEDGCIENKEFTCQERLDMISPTVLISAGIYELM